MFISEEPNISSSFLFGDDDLDFTWSSAYQDEGIDQQQFSDASSSDSFEGLFEDFMRDQSQQDNAFMLTNTITPLANPLGDILAQLVMLPDSAPTSPSMSSSNSTISSSTSSESKRRSSKFDKSSLEKKKRKKESPSEQSSVKKRAKKVTPNLWEHTKFSESASYLEINSATEEITITFEIAQTRRRQNGPLETDKNDIVPYGEFSIAFSNLDTTKTNTISLKGLLDKKNIYQGEDKPTKCYTWIRVKGTTEYLFLYCQTGKTNDVHNIITIDNEGVSTKSDHLSRYTGKCSSTVLVVGSKLTKPQQLGLQ